ncbi:DUF1330 domain-containing protein [Ramlibacter sp.]|uniref:DUF1330 domain-containing protein n=1 Tax=Ramlibacter sp. TaxID=1917967 RepID=UPI00181C3DEB|nr:DUF1330 domain-containing protein [Ramlibacter sp.]MBA2674564.1 DUF1330 domain-containing protein [Ramlibacter sp.]
MTTTLPKGYCLADITVHDATAYTQYTSRSGPAVEAAGGRFVVRGGTPEVIEGDRKVTRIALVEFPTVEAAHAFYRGDLYQDAVPYRVAASSTHYAILTGNDPAQMEAPAPGGPKGYLYAEMHPTDLEKYMEYPKMSTPIVHRFGGRFIVRGGQPQLLEGKRPTGRVVIAEFPSIDRAREFYFSPEYRQAMQWRLKYAHSDICLLTGA